MAAKRPKRRPEGDPVVKALFAASGNRCAYSIPEFGRVGCEQVLYEPGWDSVQAIIAHIYGFNPKSCRYDETVDDVNGYWNLILLCPNHSRLIDDLECERHTVEILQKMKERHEQANGDSLSRAAGWTGDLITRVATLVELRAIELRRWPESTTLEVDSSVISAHADQVNVSATTKGERSSIIGRPVGTVSGGDGEPPYPSEDLYPSDDLVPSGSDGPAVLTTEDGRVLKTEDGRPLTTEGSVSGSASGPRNASTSGSRSGPRAGSGSGIDDPAMRVENERDNQRRTQRSAGGFGTGAFGTGQFGGGHAPGAGNHDGTGDGAGTDDDMSLGKELGTIHVEGPPRDVEADPGNFDDGPRRSGPADLSYGEDE